jgi:hypothetical protein
MARLDLEEASKADARGARAATAVATRENLLDTMLAKKKNDSGNKIPANYRTGKECRR